MTLRSRIRTGLALVAASAVIGAGLVPALEGTASAAPAAAAISALTTAAAKSGVYEGPCQTGQVQQFAAWRGRNVGVVTDALDQRTWASMENPTWWEQCYTAAGLRPSYAVPMLLEAGDTIQQGATGSYNAHFLDLARSLVAGGEANADLRLGWEFNGSWQPWNAMTDPASFIAYWRQIVATMRSVPGEAFTFDWNISVGYTGFDPTAAYPGDDVVDYVGLDIYDESWVANTFPYPANDSLADRTARQTRAWDALATAPGWGLGAAASFAAAHNKAITIPEWGLVSSADPAAGGDDPVFVQGMAQWIAGHNVAFSNYFDAIGSLGDHRLRSGNFPAASATYLSLFGSSVQAPSIALAGVGTFSGTQVAALAPATTASKAATTSAAAKKAAAAKAAAAKKAAAKKAAAAKAAAAKKAAAKKLAAKKLAAKKLAAKKAAAKKAAAKRAAAARLAALHRHR